MPALSGDCSFDQDTRSGNRNLSPHNELHLEVPEHVSLKVCLDTVPGRPSRRIVWATDIRDQLVCKRTLPGQGTTLAEN
jgi:hypothetical protein